MTKEYIVTRKKGYASLFDLLELLKTMCHTEAMLCCTGHRACTISNVQESDSLSQQWHHCCGKSQWCELWRQYV